MTKKIQVAPSILSADFAAMGQAVENLEVWGADLIHCDAMDGQYVPNFSFGPSMIRAIRPHTTLPLDVHMMIDRPERYVEAFAEAGADIITVHQEATIHLHRTLQLIRSTGKKCGVVLNPATPVYTLENVLEDVDMVLMMSVNPGYGGQKFIPKVLDKVRRLRAMIEEAKLKVDIEIDGGVGIHNAAEIVDAGANILVAGSAVFDAEDPADVIHKLQCAR